MLIYNYQKEFIGIDESDLKTLGFSTLSQLISEVGDFANLFVKSPGYIHNFKHVHWIDFVTCAEPNQESKVIISINDKSFRCNLEIKSFCLNDDSSNMGYVVNLLNLKALSQTEQKPVAGVPSSIVEEEHIEIKQDEIEADDTISIDDFDTFIEPETDVFEDELVDTGYEKTQKEPLSSIYKQTLEVGSDYLFDPQLASDELGLPLELIEEFVQDFIAQAKDFKNDLYNSLSDKNIDNVKILSHKLKGVVANLRIEDAFEVLTTVNSSEDFLEIEHSLDMFYESVDKLISRAGPKEQDLIEESLQSEASKESDEDMVLSFKDEDEDEAKNTENLQAIEMPELADDDFISLELDEDEPEEVKKQEVQEEQETQIYYDRVKAASEIGIDIENFNELFDDFIHEAKKYTLQIEKAIESSDFEASKNSCIRLKRMCEAMRIDSLDKELDSIMKSQDIDKIKQNIASANTKLNLISGKES